jgi:hypothetical protein
MDNEEEENERTHLAMREGDVVWVVMESKEFPDMLWGWNVSSGEKAKVGLFLDDYVERAPEPALEPAPEPDLSVTKKKRKKKPRSRKGAKAKARARRSRATRRRRNRTKKFRF